MPWTRRSLPEAGREPDTWCGDTSITGELKLRRRPDGGGVQPPMEWAEGTGPRGPAQLQAELSAPEAPYGADGERDGPTSID